MNVSEVLSTAFGHHQAGDIATAEPMYRQVLATDPQNASAWHLLGVAVRQQGRHSEAIEFIGRALAIEPQNPTFLCHYGAAQGAAGLSAEAEVSLRRALAIQPTDVQAWYNLAVVLVLLGRQEEAIDAYRRVLALDPNFVQALFNLGNLLRDMGRADEAITVYRQTINANPNYFGAYNNLGALLQSQERLDESVQVLEQVIRLRPDYSLAKINLGSTLRSQGRLDEAITLFREAIAKNPELAEAHNNLGSALQTQRKLAEAAEAFRQSMRARPDYLRAKCNLAAVLSEMRELDEAHALCNEVIAADPTMAEPYNTIGAVLVHRRKLQEAVPWIEKAITLSPDLAESHRNLASVSLFLGDFERGWPELEWRFKMPPAGFYPYPHPRWDGSRLDSKMLLVHAEQGLGDTIQFVRFVEDAKKLAPNMIVACQPSLVPLLQRCVGLDNAMSHHGPLPSFDLQVSLMSLPGLLHVPAESLSARVPYMHPPNELVEHWRKELSKFDGFKIGIVWQGNPNYQDDRFRSIPLAEYAPLARLPGVHLISLQQGFGSEQWESVGRDLEIVNLGPQLDQSAGAFMDTAAVLKNLDLVISSDTAAPHLAGALGVRVWVAIAYMPEWRWMLDREDSPWYPSMRLFRQTSAGDWASVFHDMASQLAKLVRKNVGTATQ